MSMLERSTRAYGSPSRYIQGRYELDHIRERSEEHTSELQSH